MGIPNLVTRARMNQPSFFVPCGNMAWIGVIMVIRTVALAQIRVFRRASEWFWKRVKSQPLDDLLSHRFVEFKIVH